MVQHGVGSFDFGHFKARMYITIAFTGWDPRSLSIEVCWCIIIALSHFQKNWVGICVLLDLMKIQAMLTKLFLVRNCVQIRLTT